MEVHGRQPNDRRHESDRLQKSNRDRTRAALRAIHTHGMPAGEVAKGVEGRAPGSETTLRRDVIELSTASKDGDAESRRAQKVDGLARAYRDGTLLTADRIDRAADRMLSK